MDSSNDSAVVNDGGSAVDCALVNRGGSAAGCALVNLGGSAARGGGMVQAVGLPGLVARGKAHGTGAATPGVGVHMRGVAARDTRAPGHGTNPPRNPDAGEWRNKSRRVEKKRIFATKTNISPTTNHQSPTTNH